MQILCSGIESAHIRVNLFSFKVVPWFCIAHPLLRITLRHPIWRKRKLPARLATTKGAFAGAYPCTKQVEEKTAKIWEHKSPDREEVCFENLTKISGRRVVELDLLAEALDRGCNTCANHFNYPASQTKQSLDWVLSCT